MRLCVCGLIVHVRVQVLSQVWIFSSLVVDSLAIAGQTMVAVELGKGDPAAARDVTNRSVSQSVIHSGTRRKVGGRWEETPRRTGEGADCQELRCEIGVGSGRMIDGEGCLGGLFG